jgi:hypothetical protein
MKRFLILLFICWVLSVATGCMEEPYAPVVPQPPPWVPAVQNPPPGVRMMHAPEMVEGDKWTYKEAVTVKPFDRQYAVVREITRVNPDKSYEVVMTQKEDGKQTQVKWFVDKNLRTIRGIWLPSNQEVTDFRRGLTPGFPFWVGKRWQRDYRSKTAVGDMANFRRQYEAEGFETITVAAGNFETVRVLYHEYNLDTGSVWKCHFWYSPEAKSIISRECDYCRDELTRFVPGKK